MNNEDNRDLTAKFTLLGIRFRAVEKKKVIKRELYDQKELKLAVGRDLKLGETSRGERQNSSA